MNDRGFTLIELLITIAIIGILAAIGIPGYIGIVKSSARSEAYTNLENLRLLEQQFFADRGRYSPCTAPAYTSPAPGTTVLLGTAGKDNPGNVAIIQTGNGDINNALSGFRPGTGANFSYWIVNGQRITNANTTPPTTAALAAGEPPCYVAFAQGNTIGRNTGETFAIDCNNNKNF